MLNITRFYTNSIGWITKGKGILLLMFFSQFLISNTLRAQICAGEPFTLTHPLVGTQEIVEWVEKGTTNAILEIDGSISKSPTVHPLVTTTYTVNYVDYTTNYIDNGDFEDVTPATAYSTLVANLNYTQFVGVNNPPNNTIADGYYYHGTNPLNFHPDWYAPIKDHTKQDGSGYMLCFNGAQSTSEVIYRNSITIPTGGKFVFSVWVANLHIDKQNPFQMEFYIDGVATGNTFNGNSYNFV